MGDCERCCELNAHSIKWRMGRENGVITLYNTQCESTHPVCSTLVCVTRRHVLILNIYAEIIITVDYLNNYSEK